MTKLLFLEHGIETPGTPLHALVSLAGLVLYPPDLIVLGHHFLVHSTSHHLDAPQTRRNLVKIRVDFSFSVVSLYSLRGGVEALL